MDSLSAYLFVSLTWTMRCERDCGVGIETLKPEQRSVAHLCFSSGLSPRSEKNSLFVRSGNCTPQCQAHKCTLNNLKLSWKLGQSRLSNPSPLNLAQGATRGQLTALGPIAQ